MRNTWATGNRTRHSRFWRPARQPWNMRPLYRPSLPPGRCRCALRRSASRQQTVAGFTFPMTEFTRTDTLFVKRVSRTDTHTADLHLWTHQRCSLALKVSDTRSNRPYPSDCQSRTLWRIAPRVMAPYTSAVSVRPRSSPGARGLVLRGSRSSRYSPRQRRWHVRGNGVRNHLPIYTDPRSAPCGKKWTLFAKCPQKWTL